VYTGGSTQAIFNRSTEDTQHRSGSAGDGLGGGVVGDGEGDGAGDGRTDGLGFGVGSGLLVAAGFGLGLARARQIQGYP
jgi:hypothetical protein